jgi:hypothetical protein
MKHSLILGALVLACQQATAAPPDACPAPPAPHPEPYWRSLEIQDQLEAVMSATVCRYNDQVVERLARKRRVDAGEWASAWSLKERCRADWWQALWRTSLQQQLDAGWECTAEALTLGPSGLPKGITCTPPGGAQ